jgi:hypothetical protein
MTEPRHITLLKAALALLTEADNSIFVIDVMSTTVHYDGADCDGGCLRDDIKHYLEYEADAKATRAQA